MRNISVMLGALCAISICGPTIAAGKAGRIDKRSVWSGGGDFSSCQTILDDGGKRSCLIALMRRRGASPQAIEFTRGYKDLAYISKFTAYGPVDLAIATSPFMANSNDSYILVNGAPSVVDVAEQASDRRLTKYPVYRAFKSAHANLDLWPLDGELNRQERLGGGGRRFVFSTSFRHCHACVTIAEVQLAYDFDRSGRFLGTKLVNITNGTGGAAGAH
jgi:hypothetical protein